MGDTELSGYDARTDTLRGELYYLQPNVVWKRATIDENSTKLVHSTLA